MAFMCELWHRSVEINVNIFKSQESMCTEQIWRLCVVTDTLSLKIVFSLLSNSCVRKSCAPFVSKVGQASFKMKQHNSINIQPTIYIICAWKLNRKRNAMIGSFQFDIIRVDMISLSSSLVIIYQPPAMPDRTQQPLIIIH